MLCVVAASESSTASGSSTTKRTGKRAPWKGFHRPAAHANSIAHGSGSTTSLRLTIPDADVRPVVIRPANSRQTSSTEVAAPVLVDPGHSTIDSSEPDSDWKDEGLAGFDHVGAVDDISANRWVHSENSEVSQVAAIPAAAPDVINATNTVAEDNIADQASSVDLGAQCREYWRTLQQSGALWLSTYRTYVHEVLQPLDDTLRELATMQRLLLSSDTLAEQLDNAHAERVWLQAIRADCFARSSSASSCVHDTLIGSSASASAPPQHHPFIPTRIASSLHSPSSVFFSNLSADWLVHLFAKRWHAEAAVHGAVVQCRRSGSRQRLGAVQASNSAPRLLSPEVEAQVVQRRRSKLSLWLAAEVECDRKAEDSGTEQHHDTDSAIIHLKQCISRREDAFRQLDEELDKARLSADSVYRDADRWLREAIPVMQRMVYRSAAAIDDDHNVLSHIASLPRVRKSYFSICALLGCAVSPQAYVRVYYSCCGFDRTLVKSSAWYLTVSQVCASLYERNNIYQPRCWIKLSPTRAAQTASMHHQMT